VPITIGRLPRRADGAKTFALAMEEAAKLHSAAEPLIIYAALLAPEAIPVFLFAETPKISRRVIAHRTDNFIKARKQRPAYDQPLTHPLWWHSWSTAALIGNVHYLSRCQTNMVAYSLLIDTIALILSGRTWCEYRPYESQTGGK
jgi:hypothetical protein